MSVGPRMRRHLSEEVGGGLTSAEGSLVGSDSDGDDDASSVFTTDSSRPSSVTGTPILQEAGGFISKSSTMRHRPTRPKKEPQLLCTLGVGQTIGENALLAGPDDRRVVTLKALTPCEYMIVDRGIFNWFTNQYPNAILSFILTTTCRQWRVAYVTLVEILGEFLFD